MSKKLIIFPFGGNARETLVSIFAINKLKNEWDIIGFIDDNPSNWKKDCCGVKVVGGREILKKMSDAYILAVPGNPNNYLERKEIIESLNIENSRYVKIVHPSVIISSDAKIGYNTILMPNVVISCGVKIGNHCVVLPNTVIAHDSIVGDFSCIGSNVTISGHVTIGSICYIGSGTKIRDNLSIGSRTLIGLGSNVISNIDDGVIVAGNPAKVINKKLYCEGK